MSDFNEPTLFTETQPQPEKVVISPVKTWKERDDNQVSNCEMWEKLTLAQKFSASNLSKFGYKLDYLRETVGLAVLNCNGKIAVINGCGEIDSYPEIATRNRTYS